MIEIACLDMDGVLTAFEKQALKLFGYPEDTPVFEESMEKLFNITPGEFWDRIEEAGIEFWADMPETPECDEILNLVDKYADEFIICTSPTLSPNAAYGKMVWMQRKFGKTFDRFLIGKRKYAMSHPGNVLIDDFEKNVKRFTNRPNPGDGIIVPRTWNSFRGYSDRVVEIVEQHLQFHANC